MDDKKWFLMLDGQVSGPHSVPEAENRLANNPSFLIWGRGQNDWLDMDRWKRGLREMESLASQNKAKAERMWRVRVGSNEQTPMSHDQMMTFLKSKNDLAEIRIWTEGYNEWKEIYQIHKIMDELGVSRRKHPRVPIMGQVSCEKNGEQFQLKALSISEGGLGVTDAQNLNIGDSFKLALKSPNLYGTIHANVEVVYIGGDGYAGLRFSGIHSESKSAIIEYVKKFTETRPGI